MKYCEICGGKCKEEILTLNESKVSIFVCEECNLFQVDNMVFDFQLNDNIDFNSMEKSFKKLRTKNFQTIVESLKLILPIGSTGLEIGSLQGWFLDVVNEYYQCYGIEPLKDIVECSDRHTVYKGFFPDDLPSDISNLNFLVFNDVFEHISDCATLMKHCNTVLEDGGYLIINLPLSTGIFFRLARLISRLGNSKYLVRMWQFKFSSPHLYYFNKNNLSALASKYGFELVSYKELDILDKDSVRERIMTDATENNVRILQHIVKIGYPFLRFFKSDIGFLTFKKIR